MNHSSSPHANRSAIATGSGRNIGRALVLALAAVDAVVKEITADGGGFTSGQVIHVNGGHYMD
jgi:hypothetical protein